MDSQGNLYLISDEQQAKLRKELLTTVTTEQAREMKLKPVNRPLKPYERKAAKIGRNSPCGCGSGLKFKRCCYGK